jgi:hypothetical protein
MSTSEERKLLEKLVRAKVRLEGMQTEHKEACPAVDPEMAGRCTCGTDTTNGQISAVLRELSLDD